MLRFLFFVLIALIMSSCLRDHKKVVVVHPEGFYKEVYTVRDDSIRDGIYKKYNSDGLLADSCNYNDNLLNGERKLFTKDGHLEIMESYSLGHFEGPYSTYYQNGQVKKIQNYIADKIQGEVKEFYQDGTLKALTTFEDNIESGPFSEYHENGIIHWEGSYKGGDFEQDTLKEFNKNGLLIRKLFCVDGICQTVWKPETGKISPKEIFDNN